MAKKKKYTDKDFRDALCLYVEYASEIDVLQKRLDALSANQRAHGDIIIAKEFRDKFPITVQRNGKFWALSFESYPFALTDYHQLVVRKYDVIDEMICLPNNEEQK